MKIETFKQLKELLSDKVSIAAQSDNARIVWVNGNKIVLPIEV